MPLIIQESFYDKIRVTPCFPGEADTYWQTEVHYPPRAGKKRGMWASRSIHPTEAEARAAAAKLRDINRRGG